KNYGAIRVGEIKEGGPFILRLANIPEKESLSILVKIISSDSIFYSLFNLLPNYPNFSYISYRFIDGNNNIPEPQEEGDLYLRIKNIGNSSVNNIIGKLRTKSNASVILDSISQYGDFNVLEERENQTPFRIRIFSDVARNRRLVFMLYFYRENNLLCSLKFSFNTGIVDSFVCSYPSFYNYYAYEDIDYYYSERPVFNWVEIDPNLGGRGTKINLRNDDFKVLSLPPAFNFRFCGDDIRKITVSDNGVLILDSVRFTDFYNWSIYHPFVYQKSLLIFWDDFHPETLNSSGVYYYYDTLNNRFIIQWSRIKHIHGFISPQIGEEQTFQIILYDINSYPTRTGDGIILFQYLNISDDDSFHNYSTIGIREKDFYNYPSGIEIKFGKDYSQTFGNIRNNKAIKFTPNPPDTYTFIVSKERNNILRFLPTILKAEKLISLQKERKIEIYDITGKRWRIENLRKGIYFLIIKEKNLKIKKKIILVR
ncbi:MAG: hypothetical protein NZ608_07585, partial [candidate division WOR-3 bacterium]|nr:hypothetical protein [candidate division WOR-3 bacterium]